jgi:hypothetical protein
VAITGAQLSDQLVLKPQRATTDPAGEIYHPPYTPGVPAGCGNSWARLASATGCDSAMPFPNRRCHRRSYSASGVPYNRQSSKWNSVRQFAFSTVVNYGRKRRRQSDDADRGNFNDIAGKTHEVCGQGKDQVKTLTIEPAIGRAVAAMSVGVLMGLCWLVADKWSPRTNYLTSVRHPV